MKKDKNVLRPLEHWGWQLEKTIDCPVEDILPDAKQYIFKQDQGKEQIIFDTQQGFVKIGNYWFLREELESIICKMKEYNI